MKPAMILGMRYMRWNLLFVLASFAQAQQPVQVDVTVRHDASPLEVFMRSASESAANARVGLESKQRAQELKIQQGWLDLARQQAQAQQPHSGQGNNTPAVQPDGEIKGALLLAHMAHSDFDIFIPSMQIIAQALRPDWSKIRMTEYLECLYVIAKHASFAPQPPK